MHGDLIRTLKYRWRTMAAALVGLLAGLGAGRLGVAAPVAALIGWNVAALLFLAPTGVTLLFDDAAEVRARAGREDENRAVMMSLVLAAVAVSFCAVVLALMGSKGAKSHADHLVWVLALSAATLIINWLVVQSLFALHYAHRYFGDRDGDGSADKGFEFPGRPADTYRDFIYASICIGATCQVADFDVTSPGFRNLVTVHALIAFLFNTMVLALGINIFASVMGQ